MIYFRCSRSRSTAKEIRETPFVVRVERIKEAVLNSSDRGVCSFCASSSRF